MTDQRWREIWDIYYAACELDAAERRRFARSATTDSAVTTKVLAMLDRLEEAASEDPTPDTGDEWPQMGKVFGRFAITGRLGRGATGEVYAGRDTELSRPVALKFLGAGIPGSAGAVDRVVREAQTASALNHPGIVTVYGVIRSDSLCAVVMELVEGDSLRIFCGAPQPVSRVANWGRQASLALAAAHSAGIAHRDIKPENLMLRPDGYIKVLDFGMARRFSGEPGNPTNGSTAGTLRYMSPEQVRGGRVQAPSDVFSLGIVLYELAAGSHPFQAASALETPYAIATRGAEPLRAADPSIPERFRALIATMLDKDPAKRPDAAKVAAELGEVLAGREANLVSSPRRRRLAIALVCGGLATGAIWLAATQIPMARNAKPAAAAPLLATFPATDSAGNEGHPAFSPDGMRLAFDWDRGLEGGNRGICVKVVSSGSPLVLTGDAADDFDPAWSPDGNSIAFLRRSGDGISVATVPSGGGPVRTVGKVVLSHLDAGHGLIAWPPDGESLTVADQAPGGEGGLRLFSLAVDTGEKRAITLAPEGARDLAPAFSPNGKALAFLRVRDGFPDRLFLTDSGTGRERQVISSDAPINSFAWSADGRSLVYCAGSPVPLFVGSVAVADGTAGPAPFRLRSPARELAMAAKGGHLAFARPLTDSNVWRLGAGKTPEPLVASSREDLDPKYSPDGESIAFASRRTESLEIWVAKRDGSGARQVTWQGAAAGNPSWSPNGRQIAFDSSSDPSGSPKAVWLVGAGGAQPRKLLNEAWDSFNPSWSRDGAWVYFGSTRGGKSQIWKTRSSGGGRPEQVTHDGGFEGYESFDGRDFYYTKGFTTAGVWKMPVSGGAEEEVRGLGPVFHHRYWDVADRGIYFVDSTGSPQLRLFDFGTTRVKTVAALPEAPPQNSLAPAQIVRGLSVAPDGREFLDVRFGAERVALVIADLPGR